MKKRVGYSLLVIAFLFSLSACNENVPGDPDYYSCQYFGTHCHKHGKK